jgi:hypothetical protein
VIVGGVVEVLDGLALGGGRVGVSVAAGMVAVGSPFSVGVIVAVSAGTAVSVGVAVGNKGSAA